MSEPVKAPPGHIINDQGNVLPLLGSLLLTDDGYVVAEGARVYFVGRDDSVLEWDVSGAGDHIPVQNFYSTRAAAEAARDA
jgi:hypothetical protein